jgi:hypothetical protein
MNAFDEIYELHVNDVFKYLMCLTGDGIGFSALYGRYKAERFLSYVEKGEFVSATRYMGFLAGRYEKMKNQDEIKKQWFTSMQELKNQGIEIIYIGKMPL